MTKEEIIDNVADDVDTESEMLAWEFAVTGTEQHLEYVCRWNEYKVFQHFADNPWGNHGKGISIATNFILVKNKEVRFATSEEAEELK